jgi:hypothetical protein
MATIGQALTAPESGWKRYDDTDINIAYNGGYTQISTAYTCYNSTLTRFSKDSYTSSNSVKFNFTEDKIRIIAGVVCNSTNYSSNVNINIDDVNYYYSYKFSDTGTYQTLVFEKTNLGNKEHYVIIKNLEIAEYNIDAIDLSTTGILKPYSKILTYCAFKDANNKLYGMINSWAYK